MHLYSKAAFPSNTGPVLRSRRPVIPVARFLFAALLATLPMLAQTWNLPLTASVLPAAQTGVAYSQTLNASGVFPIAWALTNGALPAGLTLNPATGVISGTPTAMGSVAFAISATNAFGTDAKQLSLTVNAAPAITTSSTLPAALVGATYSQTLSASGTAPIAWAIAGGTLPAGLTLNSTTGVISGTPTALGVGAFTVSATNAFGSNSRQLSLTVNAAPTITTTSTLPSAQAGTAYLQTMSAAGSTPITWGLTSGALAAGLTLNPSTGAIGGTPTASGLATFTVTATNAFGSNSANFTLTVNAPPIVSVSLTPSTTTLMPAQTQAFVTTVTGSSNTAVAWSLNPALGTVSTAGVYTAPSSVTVAQTVKVTATSVADSTKAATASIVLTPYISVSLTPTSATLSANQAQQFSASVTGTTSQSVNWSLSPSVGTLSSTGLYTAPASVLTAQTVTVKAQSAAYPTQSASSLISLAPACDAGVTFSGPIVISSGGTYTGNWQSNDPAVAAVNIATTAPVTIVNSRIKGPGNLLTAWYQNQVNITNNCFVGVNPNVAGTGRGSPIVIQQMVSAVIEHNDFESTGGNGVVILQYSGNYTTANSVKVRYNRFHNIDGRHSDGAGGYLTNQEGDYSHAVIFSLAKHVPGMEVAWNQIVNEPWQSQVIDSINMYSSSGTSASPVLIHDNYIQGQYSANPTNADQLGYSGTGIVTDDQPGITDPANATSWIKIYSNQVVSSTLSGISISAGHDNEMYSNRVVSSGQLPDGSAFSSIYAAGIGTNNYQNEPAGVYGNNSIHDNVSGVRRYRNGNWERSDYYFGVPPSYVSNNTQWTPTGATVPTSADESNEYSSWKQKVSSQGLTVGSTLVTRP